MQKLLILLCTLIVAFTASANSPVSSKIQWLTSYEDAVKQANTTSKPILLLFTGTDWCPYCVKLEKEILSTPEFANYAGDKFIFVLLDFPSNTNLHTPQNKELRKKYNIAGYPTIVVVDNKGQKIGSIGYEQVSGKQYAERLLKMVNDFSGYKQKLSGLDKEQFSGPQLKTLYEKAQEFGLFNDASKIMAFGFNSDEKQFFLTERYRFLASEGKMDSKEALNLKKQLFEADFDNEHFTHYHIAIIDFETLSSLADTHKKPPEFFVAPLTDYITKFGQQDKTNLWRLHMIISQVYYDKNKKEEALYHAKLGATSAPTVVQPEIAILIKNIQQ